MSTEFVAQHDKKRSAELFFDRQTPDHQCLNKAETGFQSLRQSPLVRCGRFSRQPKMQQEA